MWNHQLGCAEARPVRRDIKSERSDVRADPWNTSPHPETFRHLAGVERNGNHVTAGAPFQKTMAARCPVISVQICSFLLVSLLSRCFFLSLCTLCVVKEAGPGYPDLAPKSSRASGWFWINRVRSAVDLQARCDSREIVWPGPAESLKRRVIVQSSVHLTAHCASSEFVRSSLAGNSRRLLAEAADTCTTCI